MSNETTSTSLVSLINPEAIMEAKLAFQQNVNLVNRVRVADLTGIPTKAASWPVFIAPAVSKQLKVQTNRPTLRLRRQT